jgi:hypothetical protein
VDCRSVIQKQVTRESLADLSLDSAMEGCILPPVFPSQTPRTPPLHPDNDLCYTLMSLQR